MHSPHLSPEGAPGDLGTFLGWVPWVRPTRPRQVRHCPKGDLRVGDAVQDRVFGDLSSPVP